MYNFIDEFFPDDLIIKSSGLEILFSSTYNEINSTKSLPYFFALPSPTPKIEDNSSILIGYLIVISNKEGS